MTHEDDAALAAASRHRSDAGQSAQRMIISFAQRLRGLAEQRGEDDPSDARQGSQDRHVALLGFLPRRVFLSAFGELVGEFVELAICEPSGRLANSQEAEPARDTSPRSHCRSTTPSGRVGDKVQSPGRHCEFLLTRALSSRCTTTELSEREEHQRCP